MYSLKELCEITGCSRRAIQGYEKANLVGASSKNKMGHLQYEEDVVSAVIEIKFLQDIGFTIKEITQFQEASKEWQLEHLILKRSTFSQHIDKMTTDLSVLDDMIAKRTQT